MQPTPVTRSRLPIVAIGVWAAILAAIVVVGLIFGGRGTTTTSPAGANGIALTAPLAADPSPSASAGSSAAPSQGTQNGGPWKGPNAGAGFGGRGGPGGPGHGFGDVSIT